MKAGQYSYRLMDQDSKAVMEITIKSSSPPDGDLFSSMIDQFRARYPELSSDAEEESPVGDGDLEKMPQKDFEKEMAKRERLKKLKSWGRVPAKRSA